MTRCPEENQYLLQ